MNDYTKEQVDKLLQQQAEKLGKIHKIIWNTKPRPLQLIVESILLTPEGLVITVQ